MKTFPLSLLLFCALPVRAQSAPVKRAPASKPAAISPEAAAIFGRAARLYGGAQALSFVHRSVLNGRESMRSVNRFARPDSWRVSRRTRDIYDQASKPKMEEWFFENGTLISLNPRTGFYSRREEPSPEHLVTASLEGGNMLSLFLRGINPLAPLEVARFEIARRLGGKRGEWPRSPFPLDLQSARKVPGKLIGGAMCDAVQLRFKPAPQERGGETIYFEAKSGMLRRIEFRFKGDDGDEVLETADFEQTRFYPTLAPSIFSWKAPPGSRDMTVEGRSFWGKNIRVGGAAPAFSVHTSQGIRRGRDFKGHYLGLIFHAPHAPGDLGSPYSLWDDFDVERNPRVRYLGVHLGRTAPPKGFWPAQMEVAWEKSGFDSSVARAFGLKAAPLYVLIDPQGKIAALELSRSFWGENIK